MTTYSGYSSGTPVYLKIYLFMIVGIIAIVALSMLGTAATVQTTGPKPTPDSGGKIEGINFDDALVEAKSLITPLKPGDSAYLNRTSNGLIRVGYNKGGKLYVTSGSPSTPALKALAEQILAALVYP